MTKEPGMLQSLKPQRIGHDLTNEHSKLTPHLHACTPHLLYLPASPASLPTVSVSLPEYLDPLGLKLNLNLKDSETNLHPSSARPTLDSL